MFGRGPSDLAIFGVIFGVGPSDFPPKIYLLITGLLGWLLGAVDLKLSILAMARRPPQGCGGSIPGVTFRFVFLDTELRA